MSLRQPQQGDPSATAERGVEGALTIVCRRRCHPRVFVILLQQASTRKGTVMRIPNPSPCRPFQNRCHRILEFVMWEKKLFSCRNPLLIHVHIIQKGNWKMASQNNTEAIMTNMWLLARKIGWIPIKLVTKWFITMSFFKIFCNTIFL